MHTITFIVLLIVGAIIAAAPHVFSRTRNV